MVRFIGGCIIIVYSSDEGFGIYVFENMYWDGFIKLIIMMGYNFVLSSTYF